MKKTYNQLILSTLATLLAFLNFAQSMEGSPKIQMNYIVDPMLQLNVCGKVFPLPLSCIKDLAEDNPLHLQMVTHNPQLNLNFNIAAVPELFEAVYEMLLTPAYLENYNDYLEMKFPNEKERLKRKGVIQLLRKYLLINEEQEELPNSEKIDYCFLNILLTWRTSLLKLHKDSMAVNEKEAYNFFNINNGFNKLFGYPSGQFNTHYHIHLMNSLNLEKVYMHDISQKLNLPELTKCLRNFHGTLIAIIDRQKYSFEGVIEVDECIVKIIQIIENYLGDDLIKK